MVIKDQKKYVLRVRAVDKNIYNSIQTGKKKLETRAATPKYKNIKAGDKIIFSCQNDRFERTVKKVKIYNSIKGLIKDYKVRDINPDCSSVQELEKMYNSFPGYKTKIKNYGIIAIEFQLLD